MRPANSVWDPAELGETTREEIKASGVGVPLGPLSPAQSHLAAIQPRIIRELQLGLDFPSLNISQPDGQTGQSEAAHHGSLIQCVLLTRWRTAAMPKRGGRSGTKGFSNPEHRGSNGTRVLPVAHTLSRCNLEFRTKLRIEAS